MEKPLCDKFDDVGIDIFDIPCYEMPGAEHSVCCQCSVYEEEKSLL